MKRVIVESSGVIHYMASCENINCEWSACMFTNETPTEDAVRKVARAHVLKTGHKVNIEAAKSTTYALTTS